MLNSVSAGTLYGIAHPLQGPVDLQRVQAEIVTQDFERVYDRSAQPIAEQSGSSATNNADVEERGRILELLRYRLDRPLLEKNAILEVKPAQAVAAFLRVQDILTAAAHTTRDFTTTPSISVFA